MGDKLNLIIGIAGLIIEALAFVFAIRDSRQLKKTLVETKGKTKRRKTSIKEITLKFKKINFYLKKNKS